MAPPGSALAASWYLGLVAAAPLIFLRLRAQWKRHEKLAIDDFVFIAAVIEVLGYNATIARMWDRGLSDWKAGFPVSEDQIVTIMRMAVPSTVLYVSASWAIKSSVVLFYRIVAPPTSRMALACYAVLGCLFISWAGIVGYTLLGCRPYDKYWSRDPSYQCSAEFTLISWWLLTSLNISTNVIVVCLPITIVMKLDMRLRDKFATAFMFVLGCGVIAASSLQAYYNKQQNMMLTATASMFELSAGLIGTSLLALPKLFLGEHAFAASSTPQTLNLSHHQAYVNELQLLEDYKSGKGTGTVRYLSVGGANANGAASTLTSHHRMSAASKDSLAPKQVSIAVTMDTGKEP